MTAGEGLILGANFTDFGGRNHAHITKLKIESGNYTDNISIPVFINVRKDMVIQIYIRDKKINSIFCDGVIYEF